MQKRQTAHATSCRRTADVAGTRRGPAEARRRGPVRILEISCAISDENFCGRKKFPKFSVRNAFGKSPNRAYNVVPPHGGRRRDP